MTNEQILELAQEHLELTAYEGNDDGDVEFPTDFSATSKQLLKFARAIYEEGYDDGWMGGITIEKDFWIN